MVCTSRVVIRSYTHQVQSILRVPNCSRTSASWLKELRKQAWIYISCLVAEKITQGNVDVI